MLSLLLHYFELLASFICTCPQTNTIENELHYVCRLSQTLLLINSVFFFNACQLSMMKKGLLSLGTHSASQLST